MSWDPWDECCDECKSLGNDYYVDENDEVVCACDDCPNNRLYMEADDD